VNDPTFNFAEISLGFVFMSSDGGTQKHQKVGSNGSRI